MLVTMYRETHFSSRLTRYRHHRSGTNTYQMCKFTLQRVAVPTSMEFCQFLFYDSDINVQPLCQASGLPCVSMAACLKGVMTSNKNVAIEKHT